MNNKIFTSLNKCVQGNPKKFAFWKTYKNRKKENVMMSK